jgi:peptide chain release factor subunit 1
VRSVLDRAGRRVKEEKGLTHVQRESLRADIERASRELGNGAGAKGAHGLAVFSDSADGLFEVLRLSEPVDHEPVIADAPYLAPLTAMAPEEWCVVLVNRRTARLLCGPPESMQEVALVEDDVPGQHDQGGWSQANFQRSVDKDVADHLKHVAEVTFATLRDRTSAGILIGAPQELAGDFEAVLHPYLRERLKGRMNIDVENTSPDEVRRAASEKIAAAAREREDAALGRLAEAFGAGGRAASGLEEVLPCVVEQRIEVLLVDRGYAAAGVECPRCGWLGPDPDVRQCPLDGQAVRRCDDVAEAAIERTILQSADVFILRDRPELASHGHIAAILRF